MGLTIDFSKILLCPEVSMLCVSIISPQFLLYDQTPTLSSSLLPDDFKSHQRGTLIFPPANLKPSPSSLVIYSKGVGLSQRPISQHVHCIPTSSCILRDFIPFIILSLFYLHFPFYQINFHSSQLCFIIFHPRQHNPKHINYIIPLEVLLVYLNFLPSQVSQKRDYLCCHHLHLPFTQHTKSGFHSQHTTKAALEPITSNACIQHTQCCSVTSNTQCELFFSLSFTSQEHLTKLITLL